MRRFWMLVLSVLMLGLSVPAAAQATWTCVYDFIISDHDWESYAGSHTGATWDSSGWHDVRGGTYYRGLSIRRSFDHSLNVTHISVDFSRTTGHDEGYTSDANYVSDGITNFYESDYRDEPSEPLEVAGPFTFDTLYINIWAGIDFSGSDPGGSVEVRSVTLTGTGTPPEDDCENVPGPELTRPLQPTDRLFAFQSVQDDFLGPKTLAHSAVIFAAKANTMVSAVIDGTITEIETLDPSDCIDLFTPAVQGDAGDTVGAQDNCRVTLVAPLTGSGDYVQLFARVNNPDTAYLIHIDGDDGRKYLQIATHVSDYAYEGQTVSAGCYLGKVLNLPDIKSSVGTIGTVAGVFSNLVGALITIFGEEDQPFEAVTSVWVMSDEDTYVDAWEEYVLDPSDSAPCNSPEGYEGCMGDTRLQDASQWQSSNGVSWIQPGALMDSGSFIRGMFNLDSDRNPYALIGGYAIPLGVLSASFGTTREPANRILGPTEFEITAGDPDDGPFYTIEIKNVGDVPIRIDFICVLHETDRHGNPQSPNGGELPPDVKNGPGTSICYFKDSGFENGLDEWDAEGDVEEDDGVLLLPDEATISQENVKLKAGTYILKVIARPWTNGSYTPDDDDTSNGIEIKYAYPDDTFVTVGGMKSWGAYALKGVLTLTATITITEDSDGPFTLQANVVLPPSGVLGAQLMSACLVKESDVNDGDGDGLITPTCGGIPTPSLSATAPGTWFTWLWAQSNKFFRCELIKVINQIYITMARFFQTSLWSIRWSMMTGNAGIKWFTGDFVQWLNGSFYNIASGNATTIFTGASQEQCGNIFCGITGIFGSLESVINNFVDALRSLIEQTLNNLIVPVLRQIVDLLLGILTGVGNFIGTIFATIILNLLQIALKILNYAFFILDLGRMYFASIITAYHTSTPIHFTGLVNCTEQPQSSVICVGVWMLDNTVFSGTGSAIIPIVVGLMSIRLMMWVAYEAKRTILAVRNVY